MRTLLLLVMLLFPASLAVAAEPVTFKDWVVGSGDGFVYAITLNKSENLFGQFCYYDSGKCFYIVSFDAACSKGDSYPVLINTDIGAGTKQIVCDTNINDSKNYRYFISYEDIDPLTKNAKKIGFAIPMQSDEFRAIRFSLDGASDSIRFMLQVFEKTAKPVEPAEPPKNRDNAPF